MSAECVCCGARESEPHRAAVGKITPTARAKERSAWLTAKRHHLTNESDGHGRYLLAPRTLFWQRSSGGSLGPLLPNRGSLRGSLEGRPRSSSDVAEGPLSERPQRKGVRYEAKDRAWRTAAPSEASVTGRTGQRPI